MKLSSAELLCDGWYDGIKALGSYWPHHDDTDLQSRLAKYPKQPADNPLALPLMLPVVRAYADMMTEDSSNLRPNAIVRVLSSSETKADNNRPMSLLAQTVSKNLGAAYFTSLFFRTESRNPMRMVERLAGNETLRQRINYVLQDLFILPADIGGTVLLIDDIYNLGATVRVYSAALKKFCSVERVYSVNIAATRFFGGKDGWGFLKLDADKFATFARKHIGHNDPDNAFDNVWIERSAPDYHLSSDCPKLSNGHRSFLFLVNNDRVPCPSCAAPSARKTIGNWITRRLRHRN